MKLWKKIIIICCIVSIILTVTVVNSFASSFEKYEPGGWDPVYYIGLPFTLRTNCYYYDDYVNAMVYEGFGGLAVDPNTSYSSVGNAYDYNDVYANDGLLNGDYRSARNYISYWYYRSPDIYTWYDYPVDFNVISRCMSSEERYAYLRYNTSPSIYDGPYEILGTSIDLTRAGGDNPLQGPSTLTYEGIVSLDFIANHRLSAFPTYLYVEQYVNDNCFSVDSSNSSSTGFNFVIDSDMYEEYATYDFYISFDAITFDESGEYQENHVSDSLNLNVLNAYISSPNTSTDSNYVNENYQLMLAISQYTSTSYEKYGILSSEINLLPVYDKIANMLRTEGAEYLRNLSIYFTPNDTYYNDIYSCSAIDDFVNINGYIPTRAVGLKYRSVYGNSKETAQGDWFNYNREIEVKEYVTLNDFNLVSWLGDTLSGFFDVEIIGSGDYAISIGNILTVALGVGFIIVVLKFFAGG